MNIETIWLATAIAVPIGCIAFAVAVVVDMMRGKTNENNNTTYPKAD